MSERDTDLEMVRTVSELPPNMFIRYDAITEAWLVVETKKDAPGIKVVTHGRTLVVAVEKALASIAGHYAA